MLIANAASIINGPLDGRKSSHPSSIHRRKILSRTGSSLQQKRKPQGPALVEGGGLPFLGWEVGEVCGGEMKIDKDMKIPRHQLPSVEKEPKHLGLSRCPFLKVKAMSSGCSVLRW